MVVLYTDRKKHGFTYSEALSNRTIEKVVELLPVLHQCKITVKSITKSHSSIIPKYKNTHTH